MSDLRSRVWRAAAGAAIALLPTWVAAQSTPDRGAVEGRINGHAAKGQITEALAAYDAFVSGTKKPDVALLRPIATAELTRLARTYPEDPILFPGALERLARAGHADALRELKRAAGASPASPLAIESLASLARLDDKDAERRLGDLLKSAPVEGKLTIIRAMQEADVRSQAAAVATLLNDPDVNVRRVAARAIGVLQYKEAIPQLRALVERDFPIVRMYAAPALKRLGDASADAQVATMLAADSAEMRLEAAQAYPQAPRAPWIERLKGLRTDRDGLARVRAAEILACCDPASARAMLNEALADPMPPMRVEAARVYELKNLADAIVARRLLGDSFDHVRLHGAGTVLRLIARLAVKK